MSFSSKFSPEPDDLAFFNECVDLIQRIYVMHGQLDPMAMIQQEPGELPLFLTHAPLTTPEEKMKYIASIQHAGISLDSRRIVIALESWTVINPDPEALKLLKDIKARGGSIQEHPDHMEVVTFILESDRGTISQNFRINRLHEKMVELLPIENPVYYDRDDKDAVMVGPLTGFHIPTFVRETPEGIAYARMLADTFNLDAGRLPDPPPFKKAH